jgi:hypothetical protein
VTRGRVAARLEPLAGVAVTACVTACVTAAAAALAGCGGQAHPRSERPAAPRRVRAAGPIPAARRSRRLVWVYQLQPRSQLFQTLTVNADGEGDVGYFIGEVAGVKHNRFRLAPRELARLRRELRGLSAARTESVGGPTTVLYTIITGGRSVRLTAGRIPPRARPVVAMLAGLIARYEP